MVGNRIRPAATAGLTAWIVVAASVATAQTGPVPMTCTNPASGASWQISIDYGKAAVDANPASIKQTTIAWFDPKDGGSYTLDRESGELTASVASSTGGYFRYAHCRPEPAR